MLDSEATVEGGTVIGAVSGVFSGANRGEPSRGIKCGNRGSCGILTGLTFVHPVTLGNEEDAETESRDEPARKMVLVIVVGVVFKSSLFLYCCSMFIVVNAVVSMLLLSLLLFL